MNGDDVEGAAAVAALHGALEMFEGDGVTQVDSEDLRKALAHIQTASLACELMAMLLKPIANGVPLGNTLEVLVIAASQAGHDADDDPGCVLCYAAGVAEAVLAKVKT